MRALMNGSSLLVLFFIDNNVPKSIKHLAAINLILDTSSSRTVLPFSLYLHSVYAVSEQQGKGLKSCYFAANKSANNK